MSGIENEQVTAARLLIQSEGWQHYKTCATCNGAKKHKYKLPNTVWEIWILPGRKTFFIIKAGVAKIGKSIDQFNEYYNQYKAEIFEVV